LKKKALANDSGLVRGSQSGIGHKYSQVLPDFRPCLLANFKEPDMSRLVRKMIEEETSTKTGVRTGLRSQDIAGHARAQRRQKPKGMLSLVPSNTKAAYQAGRYHSDFKATQTHLRTQAPNFASSFRQFVAKSSSHADITALLVDWSNGDRAALNTLVPLVEKELRRLAHSYMRRESPDHTLQTTALVNEAYLKLADQKKTHWQNRAHFFGIAAQVMRRILLNHIRDQHRIKRGGVARRVSLSEVSIVVRQKARELIALDEALEKLAVVDKRKSQVVELRYFGGLNVDETAEVLHVSPITVLRDWKFARAWLAREIQNV